MSSQAPSYRGYRFPSEIISHAVWLYHRFSLSFRDAEDLLAQRGITVTYETIRQWCLTFGPAYARMLRRRRGSLGDTWYLDEGLCQVNVARTGFASDEIATQTLDLDTRCLTPDPEGTLA